MLLGVMMRVYDVVNLLARVNAQTVPSINMLTFARNRVDYAVRKIQSTIVDTNSK